MSGFESALSLIAGALGLLTAPAGYGIGIWVLAIVFAWSGLAKLRRPTLAAMAINDFGVTRGVRPHLGSALGAAELLLAVFLVSGALPIVFLPVAAGLLWLFVLLIARSLRSGKDFSCFCFGESDSGLSRLTLIRTAALALLATALAVGPRAYVGFDQAYLLQAIAAAAFVGAIALGSQVPKVLRMKSEPSRLANTEVNH